MLRIPQPGEEVLITAHEAKLFTLAGEQITLGVGTRCTVDAILSDSRGLRFYMQVCEPDARLAVLDYKSLIDGCFPIAPLQKIETN